MARHAARHPFPAYRPGVPASLPRQRNGLLKADDLIVLFGLDPDASWRGQGPCAQVDPEIFYPENGRTSKPAKKVCGGCPVRDRCLAYAIEHDERYGVWGGTSEHERRLMRRAAGTEITEDETVDEPDLDIAA